jgi:deazaflavin-dependent oxidoreductase (nitroreductase family)
MTNEKIAVTELERQMRAWIDDHTQRYLRTRGADGHIVDMRMLGGHQFTPTLLLKTIGRKSGDTRYSPLIYGCIGGNVVVIASRGGADFHPAWYLNIVDGPELSFQVGGQAFRASWHIAEGEERATLWAFMRQVYPPYDDYQAKTDRRIPVLVITPEEETDAFDG